MFGFVPLIYNKELSFEFSQRLRQFSAQFYKTLLQEHKDQNIICSPTSAWVVLSMVYYGSRGNTQAEMLRVLKLPENLETTLSAFQTLASISKTVTDFELRLANKIFVDMHCHTNPQYQNLVTTYFKTNVETLNFSNCEESSNMVNSWCARTTNNRIPTIVDPSNFGPAACVILINAIYFKGKWVNSFDRKNTKPQNFYRSDKPTILVPTMYKRSTYNYGSLPQLDAVFIELPYKFGGDRNDSTSMFVILPNTVTGLEHVELNLGIVDFQRLRDNLVHTDIELYMPKFTFSSAYKLKNVLMAMGMHRAFTNDAEISEMLTSASVPLKIDEVIQKAFIEVDEEGTEAAVVTAVVACFGGPPRPPPPPPLIVRVDRPFLFVIYHHVTNTVLFHGHIVAPSVR